MGGKPRRTSRLRELERRLEEVRTSGGDPRLAADLLEAIGLEYAIAGRDGDAERVLRQAVAIDEVHPWWKRSQHQQVLAGALAGQGKDEEALTHYRLAFDMAMLDGPPPDNMSLVARWFLASHLSRMKRYAEALELLPAELAATSFAAVIHMVRATCLAGTGQIEDARLEAAKALDAALSDDQRARIEDELAHILA